MRTLAACVMFSGVFLGSAAALADRVVLHDGTVKEGTIVQQGAAAGGAVTLKMERSGISSTVVIPAEDVERVEFSQARPTTTQPATQATTQPTARPTTQAAAKRGHLLGSMWALATGRHPDWSDPATLSEDNRQLWTKAVAAYEGGHFDEAVAGLMALRDALHDDPGRADALAHRYLENRSQANQSKWFGDWLAETRWEMWKNPAKAGSGMFDLKDVTEVETPALIGILRSHTAEALDPIKTYMPAAKTNGSSGARTTGGTGGVKLVDPVLGVTVDNALEIKDKAAFARAVLMAQLKLEPAMPAVDKAFLSQQVAEVQRVYARAADFEVQARAKLRKARGT